MKYRKDILARGRDERHVDAVSDVSGAGWTGVIRVALQVVATEERAKRLVEARSKRSGLRLTGALGTPA